MNKVEMMMRKITDLGRVRADPDDVKRWLDDYEEVRALVELAEKELEQAAGGANSDHPNCYSSGHAGGKQIDN